MTKRVHISEPYDLVVMRPSIWGNPFSHKENTLALYKVDTIQEAVEKYRDHVLNSPELIALLPTLVDKRLACICRGRWCHVNVLVDLANQKVILDL